MDCSQCRHRRHKTSFDPQARAIVPRRDFSRLSVALYVCTEFPEPFTRFLPNKFMERLRKENNSRVLLQNGSPPPRNSYLSVCRGRGAANDSGLSPTSSNVERRSRRRPRYLALLRRYQSPLSVPGADPRPRP